MMPPQMVFDFGSFVQRLQERVDGAERGRHMWFTRAKVKTAATRRKLEVEVSCRGCWCEKRPRRKLHLITHGGQLLPMNSTLPIARYCSTLSL